MYTDKAHIIAEIRRTAADNDGKPLGTARFESETGIRKSDWLGKLWARWGDALAEAGFSPNGLNAAYDEDFVITKLVQITREIGRFPVKAELQLKARSDRDFPSHNVFYRLGKKHQLIEKVKSYCSSHDGFADVLELCNRLDVAPASNEDAHVDQPLEELGFVYLFCSGHYCKIGRTSAPGRREYELSIQLPEKAAILHEIKTDDPVGIEAYWHRRFEAKRKNGEWFDLDQYDVSSFKRRKFM